MSKRNRPSGGPREVRNRPRKVAKGLSKAKALEASLSGINRSRLSPLKPLLGFAGLAIVVIAATVFLRIYGAKKQLIEEITNPCSDAQKVLLARADQFILEHRDQIVRWRQDICDAFAEAGHGHCDPLPDALFASYTGDSVKRYCPTSNAVISRLGGEHGDISGFDATESLDEPAIALYPLAFDPSKIRVGGSQDPQTARICHLLGVEVHERVHLVTGVRHKGGDKRVKTGDLDSADLTGLAAECVCIDAKNGGAASGLDEGARLHKANAEILTTLDQ